MSARLILLAVAVFGIMWGLWADYSTAIAAHFLEVERTQITSAGAWGDSFGPFTAAISALGTVLVIMTLSAQRKAVKEQADDLYRQRFESSFFELLRLLRELREDLSYRYSPGYVSYMTSSAAAKRKSTSPSAFAVGRTIKVSRASRSFSGKEAIMAALLDVRYYINAISVQSVSKEVIGEFYDKNIQPRAEPTFSPYFRIVYSILDRLRRDDILKDSEKDDYSRLLRSQLSSHELSLIAINACSLISKDLDDLLVKFRMLKYHPPSKLDARIRKAYPDIAFKPRPEKIDRPGIREYLPPRSRIVATIIALLLKLDRR